jgi:hypothetical protein
MDVGIARTKEQPLAGWIVCQGWSGRPGSNRRHSAWEDGSKIKIEDIAFPCISFWRYRTQRIQSLLSSQRKRSTNGAHGGGQKLLRLGRLMPACFQTGFNH